MLREGGRPQQTLVRHSWGSQAHLVIVNCGTPVLLKVSCLEKPRYSKVRTWERSGISDWDRGLSCVVVVAIVYVL